MPYIVALYLSQANGIFIDYIEPGKPHQNAFVERVNRSLRNEVLDLYLFRNLAQDANSSAAGTGSTMSNDPMTPWVGYRLPYIPT